MLRLTIDEYVRANIYTFTPNRVLPTSSDRLHTVHIPTCSSPTRYTVLLYHIYDVTRRQTVGSSYTRVKQSILFACRRAPVHKERPYHSSTFVYINFSVVKSCSRYYTSTERPQTVTLFQPSNRLGCDKVSYTDVFHSLEQGNDICEAVDDRYNTNCETRARYLGNIATFPTSCDASARRQLLVFHLPLLA